jgi:hypothetical protein
VDSPPPPAVSEVVLDDADPAAVEVRATSRVIEVAAVGNVVVVAAGVTKAVNVGVAARV